MAGTPGQDMNKLAINYILFVPAPIIVHVLSAATVGGLYTEEASASVDAENRTITVPASGSARFYKLSAEVALTIRSFSASGGIVTMKY